MGIRRKLIHSFAGICLTMTLVLIYPAQAVAPTFHKATKKSVSLAMSNPKAYARQILIRKGLGLTAYKCLINLWTMESHWNPKAKNSRSTAFGIGQLLIETSKDPATQIRNGIRYIGYRYENSPCKAWRFWLAQHPHWY